MQIQCYFQLNIIISQQLQSLYIPAIKMRHHPLRGVDSVHRQNLLMGTCDWARPHLCKLARHGPLTC